MHQCRELDPLGEGRLRPCIREDVLLFPAVKIQPTRLHDMARVFDPAVSAVQLDCVLHTNVTAPDDIGEIGEETTIPRDDERNGEDILHRLELLGSDQESRREITSRREPVSDVGKRRARDGVVHQFQQLSSSSCFGSGDSGGIASAVHVKVRACSFSANWDDIMVNTLFGALRDGAWQEKRRFEPQMTCQSHTSLKLNR